MLDRRLGYFLDMERAMSEVSSYYSSANPDLLRAIPPDSKRILEVGCGTGALASQFKRINPRCNYWGVEADYEASENARKSSDFDKVFTVKVEYFLDGFEERKSRFNCIVAGDVLEHLVDPQDVLSRLAKLLKPGGSIVASIPNVQHWTAIQTLLNGDWPRHESGLFDRTHLRWFTRSSIVEMFEKAGLSVTKIIARNLVPGGERLIDAVRHFGLAEDPKRFERECRAYQFVVHAIKGDLPARRVLIRGFTAEACCARPRLTEPGSFINTIPGFRYSEIPAEVEPGESVVVVRQRFNIDDKAVRKHLETGCLVVGEWDDDPWHEGLQSKMKVPVEWALKACHAVSVSTEAIAELVRPINPNVAVFPNQIAAVGPEREDVSDGVVRVYMGGQRHREDWGFVVALVNKVVAENPDRYHFVVVHDRDLYEGLETKHKTFYAFQPYEKYRELLRSCDVAMSALADTRFNRCKSDIAEIECAAESVLHARFYTYWLKCQFEKTRAAAAESREYVINNRMLCNHYRSRAAWFNQLLDDKPELDRQLFERLPELRPT
jgi:2-polyprenyl-3-methyl-5-hydroxy-6-metoxy-1,4-benzoquinol methylase